MNNAQENISFTPADAAQVERTANVRFKQQLFGNIGGGMIFALVGVVTTLLLKGTAGGFLAPALGIGAVAAIGLSCVYFAAKYLSKAVALDQDSQAKKIAAASKGKAPVITPEIEATKPMGVPFGLGASGLTEKDHTNETIDSDTPNTIISNMMNHEKLAAMESPSRAIH